MHALTDVSTASNTGRFESAHGFRSYSASNIGSSRLLLPRIWSTTRFAQSKYSRLRLRGTTTHRANGEANETASTAGAGSLSLRRRAGAATPAATRAQAVTLMALDTRKDGAV